MDQKGHEAMKTQNFTDEVVAATREMNEANEAHRQAAERVDKAALSLRVAQQQLNGHLEERARKV